jgi:hypothetical protein
VPPACLRPAPALRRAGADTPLSPIQMTHRPLRRDSAPSCRQHGARLSRHSQGIFVFMTVIVYSGCTVSIILAPYDPVKKCLSLTVVESGFPALFPRSSLPCPKPADFGYTNVRFRRGNRLNRSGDPQPTPATTEIQTDPHPQEPIDIVATHNVVRPRCPRSMLPPGGAGRQASDAGDTDSWWWRRDAADAQESSVAFEFAPIVRLVYISSRAN